MPFLSIFTLATVCHPSCQFIGAPTATCLTSCYFHKAVTDRHLTVTAVNRNTFASVASVIATIMLFTWYRELNVDTQKSEGSDQTVIDVSLF